MKLQFRVWKRGLQAANNFEDHVGHLDIDTTIIPGTKVDSDRLYDGALKTCKGLWPQADGISLIRVGVEYPKDFDYSSEGKYADCDD